MNQITTTQFSMRISDDLKKWLEALSKISARSQSQIACKAIEEYIKRNEYRLKAPDQSPIPSKESTLAWLESWWTDNELDTPDADVFLNDIKLYLWKSHNNIKDNK